MRLIDEILPVTASEMCPRHYDRRPPSSRCDPPWAKFEGSGNATTKAPASNRIQKITKSRSELLRKDTTDSKLTVHL
jgi:hypothetical protein